MSFHDYTFGLCIPPQHGVEEAERGLCQQGGGEGAQAPRQVAQLLQRAHLCTDTHNKMQVTTSTSSFQFAKRGSVADTCHFGMDPDQRIRTSG